MAVYDKLRKQDYRGAAEIAAIVGLALIVSYILKIFIVTVYYIPSPSMEPYLMVNDKIVVNKMAYSFHTIARGDIVVFDAPKSVKTPKVQALVKRVVGLPGDTVEGRCDDNEIRCVVRVYVNGKRLNEPYLVKDLAYSKFGKIDVPANSVLMMGDNRDNSDDGRFFGPTPKNTIVGRAYFRIWPLKNFGPL